MKPKDHRPERPDKPDKADRDLLDELRKLFDSVGEELSKHEVDREILTVVKRIEAKIDALPTGGGTSDAEIRRVFEPVVLPLEQLAETATPEPEPTPTPPAL